MRYLIALFLFEWGLRLIPDDEPDKLVWADHIIAATRECRIPSSIGAA